MSNFFIFVMIVILCGSSYGMTRTQLKKTLTIIKKQCVPKIGVSEDKINRIEQGVFIEDPKVMCYIACIYKSLQVIRNDKVQRDLVSKQVEALYPQDMRAAVKKGVDHCMPIQDQYSDMCEAIFFAAKCLYEFDPESFIFP